LRHEPRHVGDDFHFYRCPDSGGAEEMPEIMRQVGKWMAEFKRASNEFKWQIEAEMRNLELEAERSKQTVLPPATLPRERLPTGL